MSGGELLLTKTKILNTGRLVSGVSNTNKTSGILNRLKLRKNADLKNLTGNIVKECDRKKQNELRTLNTTPANYVITELAMRTLTIDTWKARNIESNKIILNGSVSPAILNLVAQTNTSSISNQTSISKKQDWLPKLKNLQNTHVNAANTKPYAKTITIYICLLKNTLRMFQSKM
jgi:hypothetical protein